MKHSDIQWEVRRCRRQKKSIALVLSYNKRGNWRRERGVIGVEKFVGMEGGGGGDEELREAVREMSLEM